MANENFKTINTRIALRTGDFAYWITGAGKDLELIKGEVCVCTVAATDNQATTAPTVLFKVCDTTGKKFADLKWTSALAADVYGWAKATEAEHKEWLKTNHADLDTRYNFSVEGDKLVVTKDLFVNGEKSGDTVEVGKYEFLSETEVRTILADYYTKEEVNGLIAGVIGDKDKDTKDSNTIIGAKKYVDDAIEGIVSGSGYATQSWVTGEIEKLDKADTAVDGQYVKAVSQSNGVITVERGNLPTSADYGVLSVTKGDDTITIGGTTQNPTIAVTANKFDAYGAAAGVQNNLTAYENAHASDYTNAKIDELVQGAKDYADNNDANTEYHVEYDSTNKKIKLVAGADASKMEIDATAFIKDGMIESVELVQEDASGNKGQFLKLTWNDDGKDVTYVPVGELVDVYTGTPGDEVNVAISNTNVISASLNTNVATKIAHGEEAYGWGNHANAGYAKVSDLGDLAGKDKIVEGDIEGTIAVGKISGLGALATKDNITHDLVTDFDTAVAAVKVASAGNADTIGNHAPEYFATKESVDAIPGAIDSKIIAYDAGKGFGDIITHNVVEFATSEQGGKADTALQKITTTEGHGLKVTNNNNIDIDTDVVFVLDCNW